MGIFNAVADALREFTTVVNLDMVTEAPVSEADIFIRPAKLEKNVENIYEKNLSLNQKQIFMSEKIPALFDINSTAYTRQELHLSEDKFLIAIVGNRLGQEITESFEKFMFEILQKNKKTDFVIIGEAGELQNRLTDSTFDKRIHYLGYCTDLKGVVATLDIYLNPERLGGGWSSAIALSAGIPVVTLKKGDVAYNVSEKFIVSDYNEMYEVIRQYMDDKEFAYIEYYADSIQYNIAKRYMRFSNSAPLVYMTYSILQRIEIDNLKHIVEGIRYNQPVSKIENTLIYA